MKKLINILTIVSAVFFATNTFAQPAFDLASNDVNHFNTISNRYASEVPNVELKNKNLALAPAKKVMPKKNVEASIANVNMSGFISKGATTSYTQPLANADGSYTLSINHPLSTVGHVALNSAKVTFDKDGIISIEMNIAKAKGKSFTDAHVAAYGHPNNENVLDNFSWVLNGFVLEVNESNNKFTASYTKSTPQTENTNSGVSFGLF